jgi:hypothetical protein
MRLHVTIYTKNVKSTVIEIPEVKETIWIGFRTNVNVGLIIISYTIGHGT